MIQSSSSDDVAYERPAAALESTRSELQAAVTKYVSDVYVTETVAGSVFAKDRAITIAITGEKPNLRNFSSGKWSSLWSLTLSAGAAVISGDVKV